MRCELYDSEGPLLSVGTCELEGDGIRMVTAEWHATPQLGSQPLGLMTESGKSYAVRVDAIDVLESRGEGGGPVEEYRLTMVDDDAERTVVPPPQMQSTPSLPAHQRPRML